MKECSKCQHCYDDSANFCPRDNTPLITTIYGDAVISGRYILEKRLGKGGMGIVFRAKHKFLKSLHAIKVILPSLVEQDSNLLTRFKQEAILAASINHPNVIRVTDFGVEHERMPFLVMEYVNGTPLSHFFNQEKRLPVEKAYLFFQPIALGVAEAHQKGIVHRDLKPQNIMVEKNLPLHKAVKVLDFGLAKIKSVESFGSLIQANTLSSILGSPQYMSPEQWENEGVDHRTDIYSLGVILFQMLTGHLPFDGDSIPAVMYQHLTAPPPPFNSFGVSLPPAVEAVVRRSLEKKQTDRFSSIEEMLNEFELSLGGSTIAVNVGSFAPPTSKDNLSEVNRFTNDKTRNLSESQKQRILNYFDASDKPAGILADEQLAQEFLEAQDRAEEAKLKATQAERLVQELAEAQKTAEEAQQKAIEARQKIEADVRRRVEAEMEEKLAEQQARQKAEAERLAQEAEARRQAEERANYLAQAALEAQKQAEAERKKSEQEAHQRELEESVRKKAEIAAAQLAEQVAEAKRQYEEARKQAEAEAEKRRKAELKRQKIEAEMQAAAEKEAERRAQAEAEARKYIEEQAHRFEKEALTAQQRVEEARRLAEIEAKKREEAELARQNAEEEARRLAQEIIEVQRQMEEIKMHTTSGTGDQSPNLLHYHGGHPGEYTNQIAAKTNTGEQVTATSQGGMEVSRVTVEAQVPASSNPSYSGFLNVEQTAGRKISLPMYIGGGLAAFITVLLGGFMLYSFITPNPDPAQDDPSVNKSGNTTTPQATPPKPELILIEGGSFKMGRDDVDQTNRYYGDQFPAHLEKVESFEMSRTEITNEEYAEFINEKKYPAPQNWENDKIIVGEEKKPVTFVSLDDAIAYAEWFSKRENKTCRLPTEIEWEYAARNGSEATTYPWGNEWREGAANLNTTRLSEVGKYPEETKSGLKDMLGNVTEWTSSRYAVYDGNKMIELDDKVKGDIVFRGFSLIMESRHLANPQWLITYRHHKPRNEKQGYLGFRIVCEVKQ
jgi:serine/threonine protein kinase/formylglycine-generating enzyme required for sulfatase activity